MNGLAAWWTGRALSEVVGAEIDEAIWQIYQQDQIRRSSLGGQ
jgi:hypothetical protein